MGVGSSVLASADTLNMDIPSNSLNNNFNAAIDLSSLFGGYQKIGGLRGSQHRVAAFSHVRTLHTVKPLLQSANQLTAGPTCDKRLVCAGLQETL